MCPAPTGLLRGVMQKFGIMLGADDEPLSLLRTAGLAGRCRRNQLSLPLRRRPHIMLMPHHPVLPSHLLSPSALQHRWHADQAQHMHCQHFCQACPSLHKTCRLAPGASQQL